MQDKLSFGQLRESAGQELMVSDWIRITQDQIDLFADATGDHQWIHVSPERCLNESPFKTTIAHGFLTLSLIPSLMGSLCMPGAGKIAINYGLNKVRFPSPAPVDSEVRGRMTLLRLEEGNGYEELTWQVTIERKGSDKPVCIAEIVYRIYAG